MGTYLQVLRVLGLEQDLSLLAADDVVGRRLQDAKLPRRKRVATVLKAAVLPRYGRASAANLRRDAGGTGNLGATGQTNRAECRRPCRA